MILYKILHISHISARTVSKILFFLLLVSFAPIYYFLNLVLRDKSYYKNRAFAIYCEIFLALLPSDIEFIAWNIIRKL